MPYAAAQTNDRPAVESNLLRNPRAPRLTMENKLPRVAVVILAWNGKKFLEKFLPSVVSSTYANLEICVADNHSTDGTADYIREHWPKLKLIRLERNEGFAAGYNSALTQVSADYFVLLNQDVEIVPGWIEPVIALMEKDAAIAAAQPKLMDFRQREKFEYAGGAGGFIDRWGYPFCRGRLFDTMETDTGQYDGTREIFWATGAALFIRAGLFKSFGGFDGDFFAHMEEIDLCWRLKNAGHKIFGVGESSAFHVGGGSLPMGNPRKTFLNFRNNLILILKNMTAGELCWRFPLRLVLDQLAALRALAGGNTADFCAILKAQGHVVFQLGKWLRHRKAAQKAVEANRVGPRNLAGTFCGSVVRYYFQRGVKRFSDLPPDKFAK
jgi:GT2 family glycosyltransferase